MEELKKIHELTIKSGGGRSKRRRSKRRVLKSVDLKRSVLKSEEQKED